MSDPISFVMPGAVPLPLNATTRQPPQQQPAQKTFAETLDQKPGAPSAPGSQTPVDSTQPLAESFRQNLQQELQRTPMAPGDTTSQMLQGQFNSLRNPVSYLRDAVGGLNRTPQGSDLKGMLNNLEVEWFDLEKSLRTVNELTTGGQLLGLQARLYKVAQHIEVMSKVVDQTTGGLKTVINTNV